MHALAHDARAQRWRPPAHRLREQGDDRPMPATRDDLAHLRGVLYMLQSKRMQGDAVVQRAAVEALERAIRLLEEPGHATPTFWILGALRSAWRKAGPNRYALQDADLHTWALNQIHALHGDEAEG